MADLAFIAIFLLMVIAVLAIVFIKEGPTKDKKHPNAQWQLEEHPRAITPGGPGAWAVYCVHPDEEPQLVDAVYWDDLDFEDKIEMVRSEGRMRLAALNSKELKR